MENFKPEGYNSVSPYLIVDDAQRMIDMLIEVFGGVPLRRFNREDGGIMHAEVRLDDSVVMISQSTAEYPQNNSILHVYVPDVDGTFEKGIAYGCREMSRPVSMDGDPDKRGMFQDFAGNLWSVSTQQ
jgi:uncharacterized glyoxalase superfamily protein PhnB